MLKFENPVNGRFYYIKITNDLLGHAVLTVIHGGKGISITKHYGYNCQEKIIQEISRLTKLRLRHGYAQLI